MVRLDFKDDISEWLGKPAAPNVPEHQVPPGPAAAAKEDVSPGQTAVLPAVLAPVAAMDGDRNKAVASRHGKWLPCLMRIITVALAIVVVFALLAPWLNQAASYHKVASQEERIPDPCQHVNRSANKCPSNEDPQCYGMYGVSLSKTEHPNARGQANHTTSQQGNKTQAPVHEKLAENATSPIPDEKVVKPASEKLAENATSPVPEVKGVKPASVHEKLAENATSPVPEAKDVKPASEKLAENATSPVPDEKVVEAHADEKTEQAAAPVETQQKEEAHNATSPVPDEKVVKPASVHEKLAENATSPVPKEKDVTPNAATAAVKEEQGKALIPVMAEKKHQKALRPSAPAASTTQTLCPATRDYVECCGLLQPDTSRLLEAEWVLGHDKRACVALDGSGGKLTPSQCAEERWQPVCACLKAKGCPVV